MNAKPFQTTIAFAAWITAVAALGVGIWQGYENRRHNKLSVMPKLNIHTNVSTGYDFIGMSMSNQGLGPSQIKLIRLYVDGQPVADGTKEDWPKVLEKLGINDSAVEYNWIYGQTVLKAGSIESLFGIRRANYTDERISKISRSLERIGVIVCYCSLYDECSNIGYGNFSDNPCN